MANLEFDDVQLDVEFDAADSRANLVSEENIAIGFGKLSKWYEALVPTGGSSGQFLGFNSSGTAKWVANPNTDQKVKSTLLAASTAAANYYPTFVSAAGTSGVNIIESAHINHTPGTTSAVGNTRLVLGNATNEGTANNEEGLLRIYSPGTKYHTIKGAKITTDNVEHTLPTASGTILSTGNTTTSSIGSASAGTAIPADDITSWSAGTLPSLTTTTHSVPNVTGNTSVTVPVVTSNNSVTIPNVTAATSVSIPNVTGNTSVSIPNVTGNTEVTIPNVTGNDSVTIPNVTGNTSVTVKSVKTANTPTACKIQSGVLTFTKGTAVTTENKTATNTTLGNSLTASKVTLGTALKASKVTLGTALSASKVTLGTALSASKVTLGTSLTATNTVFGTDTSASKVTLGTAFSIKGVNVWSAGTLPSLEYTAKSIPNITVTSVTNVLKKT